MAQGNIILEYMMNHEWITPNDAIRIGGGYKLSTQIGLLRKKGYIIKSEWDEGLNRFGSRVRFKKYHLIDEEKGE